MAVIHNTSIHSPSGIFDSETISDKALSNDLWQTPHSLQLILSQTFNIFHKTRAFNISSLILI